MNTTMLESSHARSSFWVYAAHFMAGLTAGMGLYAAHLFVIADNMSGKPTAAEGTAICWGLLWPVVTTVYALTRARVNPVVWLRSFAVTMALTLVLIPCVFACGFILFLIAFSGYC